MKGICILGATGSIGVSTLDVVKRHADEYRVIALTANTNIDTLFEQCLEFNRLAARELSAACHRRTTFCSIRGSYARA